MCWRFINHPGATHKQVQFTEVLFQTPAATCLLISQFLNFGLQISLNSPLQDLTLDLFCSLTTQYTSMDLFAIYYFCPCENILRCQGNFRGKGANWFWKHRSPNRYSLQFVSRLSALPSTLSSQEIASTVSFALCPCSALTFPGQRPTITSSFTDTFVRSNILTDTSTISPTYLKWKYRWSQSLCCSYRRRGSRTGCRPGNITSITGWRGDLLIVLQLVSQQELDAFPPFLWHPHSPRLLSRPLTPLLSPRCKQRSSWGDTGHPLLCPVSSPDGSWARLHPGHASRLVLHVTPWWRGETRLLTMSHPNEGWRWLDSCSSKVLSLYDCMGIIPFSLCLTSLFTG